MRKRINSAAMIAIAVLLLAVLLMDISMMFGQLQQQATDAGISQLKDISGELEKSIADAEALTMELAIGAREVLEDRTALETYLIDKKEEIVQNNTGAFNLYIAGSDWWIVPDYDSPLDFVPQDRTWYKGAIRSGGEAFLSSPYQDGLSGDICYTVSVALGDGRTVIAVDYTMDTIQSYVKQIHEEGIRQAIIVTNNGIIAGSSDDSLIGEPLMTAVPEFSGIWSLSRQSDGFITTRIKSDFLYENLFAMGAGDNWVLIVSVSDWELYHTFYIQLIITALLLAALIVTVIVSFVSAKKGREQTEDEAVQRRKTFESRGKREGRSVNKQYRNRILAFMIVVMLLSLYSIFTATYHRGNVKMQNEAQKYENDLSEWISTQKSILDMFTSAIASDPDMLQDYEGTVRYLDGITRQFPEISASYFSNPEMEPTVFMNNGWKPGSDLVVEERPWYAGALSSETGWYMTAPYYDNRTGGYCVTISERVHDAETGAFLGIFGIDFYMDKLVEILGDSYSSEGYAFLVDVEGYIVNHPYGKYQMSEENQTSVLELPYSRVKPDGQDTKLIRDYDGSLKILLAEVDETSRFSVYVVSSAMLIYGRLILFSLICLSAFLVCIVMIYRLLSGMIAWQNEVNRRLEKAAQTDAMTELLNKASTEEAISQAVKHGSGALLVIDLDNFKLVNDLFSHDMGDRILIRFAALIQSFIRENDIAGRIGGDEFAVFCEGLTDETAIRRKTEFLNDEIVKSAREYMGRDMELPLGASAGVALAPQQGREYSILFAKADLALHEVKRGSKHDVRFFRDQETERADESSSGLSSLRMIFGERNVKRTALVADRELFHDIYRYMVRLASVNGWDLHLIEFTLQTEAERPDCTERFIELAANLLRNCDVILKYNDRQVILLLMEPENRDYMIPVGRVLKAWAQEGVPEVAVSCRQELVNKFQYEY